MGIIIFSLFIYIYIYIYIYIMWYWIIFFSKWQWNSCLYETFSLSWCFKIDFFPPLCFVDFHHAKTVGSMEQGCKPNGESSGRQSSWYPHLKPFSFSFFSQTTLRRPSWLIELIVQVRLNKFRFLYSPCFHFILFCLQLYFFPYSTHLSCLLIFIWIWMDGSKTAWLKN